MTPVLKKETWFVAFEDTEFEYSGWVIFQMSAFSKFGPSIIPLVERKRNIYLDFYSARQTLSIENLMGNSQES